MRGYVLVDDADLPLLEGRGWYLDASGYARSDWPTHSTRLHRLLMQPPPGVGVDHINGDKLDCRRANLRLATQAQNTQNVRTAKGPMRGVYLDRRDGRWYGQVKHHGHRHNAGRFKTEEEAQAAVIALRSLILPFAVEQQDYR